MRARICAFACSRCTLLLCLLAFTQTAQLTPHCRRVSLALRISSECTGDVCAEITAAAPPDQQRFSVSCEVTELYRDLRCLLVTDRVPVSPLLSPPAAGESRGDTLESPAASACT